MKRKSLAVVLIIFFAVALSAQEQRKVLIKAKVISSSQYLIIARGYPKPEITNKVQMENTSKEAALLNAQVLASERFIDGFDVIRNGKAVKYKVNEEYADVQYVITYPNIKKYLRKK